LNSEAEMRAVMLHAAEKLSVAKNAKSTGYNDPMPANVLVALAYAEGILRLLASYLKVEPEKRAHATPEPGWTGQRPADNGGQPAEKTERNAAVVAAMAEAGAVKKEVAQRFGISPRRVDQILAATNQ
jgi:hypothetical protein